MNIQIYCPEGLPALVKGLLLVHWKQTHCIFKMSNWFHAWLDWKFLSWPTVCQFLCTYRPISKWTCQLILLCKQAISPKVASFSLIRTDPSAAWKIQTAEPQWGNSAVSWARGVIWFVSVSFTCSCFHVIHFRSLSPMNWLGAFSCLLSLGLEKSPNRLHDGTKTHLTTPRDNTYFFCDNTCHSLKSLLFSPSGGVTSTKSQILRAIPSEHRS